MLRTHASSAQGDMSCTRRHGGSRALLAALLACALAAATAQQPPGSDSGQDQVSTAMVALLAAVVAVFVFIAASTVYLRHCSGRYDDAVASSGRSPADGAGRGLDDGALFSSRSWWQRRRRRRVARGLDAEAVEAFPTMTYAEAKALRVGTKGGGGGALECAVCLSEFEDGDRLRLLLPRCSHAFHPDCIGEWLAGHVTCPVCRCNLEPSGQQKDPTSSSSSDGEPAAATIPFASSVSSETAAAAWRDGGGTVPVAVVIDVVTEEEEEDRRQEAVELHRIGSRRRAMRSRSQLARWHSTGNSLAARLDRDLERFTLRLPEHVRREMVAAASEHSMQLRRSAPLGRSGGWQSILGGTFSGRLAFFSASRMAPSSGDGEVSSSSSYSYSRLRGRQVAALPVNVADVVPVGDGSTCLDRDGVGAASIEVAAAPPDEENAAKQ